MGLLAKVLGGLTTAKGAAAAAVIVAASATGVVATNPEVQQAFGGVVVSQPYPTPGGDTTVCLPRPSPGSQTAAMVHLRNAADKKLRDAYQAFRRHLERATHGRMAAADREAMNAVLRATDVALRAELAEALNEIAKLTQGREGLIRNATPTPTPNGTPTPTPSPTPTDGTVGATPSPTPTKGPCPGGLVPTDLSAHPEIEVVVAAALSDMRELVDVAKAELAKLPAAESKSRPEQQRPRDKPSGAPQRGRP